MRILDWLERFWMNVYPGTEDGRLRVEAVCPCWRCNGRPLPTSKMVRRELRWFCSEEAYREFSETMSAR